jgi:soluble lytic murein transglycosylase-like protein
MSFGFHEEVREIASQHGLDVQLVEAICIVESSGDTGAYRHEPAFWLQYMASKPEWKGKNPKRYAASYGLMQVMFTSALLVGYNQKDPPEMLYVPTIGLDFGCRILKNCLAWSRGDVKAALAAYNGGRTADNGPDRQPKRNQVYVDKVLKEYEKIKAIV